MSAAKSRTPKPRKLTAAQRAAARAEHDRLQAAEQERIDEAAAPASQRRPVTAPNGTPIRGPRVERDGITFTVSNPIRRLQRVSDAIVRRGHAPTVTATHVRAADRLLKAHETAGEGVGMGHSNYEGSGVHSTPQSGYIGDGVINSINRQIAAHLERQAVRAWLRERLWGPIQAVVLDGVDVTAWASSRRQNPRVALGYLIAALDGLADFYAMRDRAMRKPEPDTCAVVAARIRGIPPGALAAALPPKNAATSV